MSTDAADGGGGPVMDRRTLIKSVGVTAGGALTMTTADRAGLSPIGDASALAVTTAAVAGAFGVGVLGGVAGAYLLGDERDYSGYTGADALHTEVYEGALELGSTHERVMTSINNNVQYSQNIALAKGKAAVIKEMNAGNSESQANTAMEEAIDAYFASIQKNLITHHDAQVNQVKHYIEEVVNHANLTPENLLSIVGYADDTSSWNISGIDSLDTYDKSLIDGTAVPVDSLILNHTGQTSHVAVEPFNLAATARSDVDIERGVIVQKPDGTAWATAYDPRTLAADNTTPDQNGPTWNRLLYHRDQVYAALTGFVADVYNQWDPGEIPTEDLVDPITAATELRQNYDGYQTRAAHAAMLGIPTNADLTMQLTLETDGVTVWAEMYTNHNPTDSNGNEVGFKQGTTYDPGGWSEPVYIAYEQVKDDGTTETDFIQVEQPFTIEYLENQDGQEVTQFQPESRNTQTADVSTLQQELDQIREQQLAMQEEAQSDGGGGWTWTGLGFGLPNWAIPVGVAGLAGLGILSMGRN